MFTILTRLVQLQPSMSSVCEKALNHCWLSQPLHYYNMVFRKNTKTKNKNILSYFSPDISLIRPPIMGKMSQDLTVSFLTTTVLYCTLDHIQTHNAYVSTSLTHPHESHSIN